MIQKLFTCVLLPLLTLCTAAGQPKYKEVYEAIQNMSDLEAFQTLFAYQAATTSKDFVNVNGYYQMGLITQRLMRHYDPFVEPIKVTQNISNTKTYLSLTLHYFTEKEAHKNKDYYKASPEPWTYESIRKDIEERLADVEEYRVHFEQNLGYLTASIRKYNACITAFGKINEQNSRLNDLYFLADDELKQNLQNLQLNFDSTRYYLNELKRALEAYPMGSYKISYSLQPIPVYRLNGLTASSFLSENITLWDYTSWVNAFNRMLNTDVAFLYKKTEEIHATNTNLIARLSGGDVADASPTYAVDPKVVNKIYRYDYNSVAAPLLKYQEEKIRLLYHNATNVTDKSLFAANGLAKSTSYYYDLMLKKRATDSALTFTLSKATPDAVKKYDAFFRKAYRDFAGFQEYLKGETTLNDQLLRTALDAYKNNVLEQVNAATKSAAIPYKTELLYADVVMPDKLKAPGYYIHSKLVLPNKKALVAGSHLSVQGKVTPFAALLNSPKSVEWLTTFSCKEEAGFGVLTGQADNGYAIVAAGGSRTEANASYLYLLNSNGSIAKELKLPSAAMPRKLIYDDIGGTFLLAFKGDAFSPYSMTGDAMQLLMLNSANLKEVWSNTLQFSGYLSNIIRTNDRFYVYGAYSELVDAVGNSISADNRKTGAFAYPIDADGQWSALKTFDADFAYYPLLVSKISNEYVEMIAVKNTPPTRSESASQSSYYMVISANNEVYCRQ
ncbi:MAG: hypothetical protein LBO71_00900 [Prevotellaceae bacterium]|jgi:hypothetical protein|nr:hypothetical protein [Prevotellaceae bacterium]